MNTATRISRSLVLGRGLKQYYSAAALHATQSMPPARQNAPTVVQPPAPRTAPKPPRKFKPRKAAMTLTMSAVSQLRQLLDQPDPKLIKVGVKRKGCSGLAYKLEYVDKASTFDEEVVQDGVKVLIDSNALFSIIGSEMDWVEDKLNQKFVFRNPNISTFERRS
ncbi:putative iron sulfur assembly protein 1 protein [Zalerion maritima]|uniref:Iron sulfur assembly protein 1 protein n=1 Tax=Zalerion maritima TaxID=339359 RepID=A0AAD5WMZ7_9PEZI|nr:putative iron sulfur assembly protein 1 protein [Zalerion maritima]